MQAFEKPPRMLCSGLGGYSYIFEVEFVALSVFIDRNYGEWFWHFYYQLVLMGSRRRFLPGLSRVLIITIFAVSSLDDVSSIFYVVNFCLR